MNDRKKTDKPEEKPEAKPADDSRYKTETMRKYALGPWGRRKRIEEK